MTTNKKLAELLNSCSWETYGEDTQVHFEFNNGELIVAFCGSNSKVDWKNNFTFWKKPYKRMKVTYFVHKGFLKAWKACRDEVMDKIKSFNPSSIIITGHSYGGAIATFCKEDCWFQLLELRDKTRLVTFGSPRIIGFFNYKKIKERWENSTLLNNGSDIVCAVPPWYFGYRHVTKQTRLGETTHWWNYFFPTKYHMLDDYIKSIDKVTL